MRWALLIIIIIAMDAPGYETAHLAALKWLDDCFAGTTARLPVPWSSLVPGAPGSSRETKVFDRLHAAVLARGGSPEAIELWKAAGADVKGTRIRFPRGLCRSIIQKSAPREYEPVANEKSAAITTAYARIRAERGFLTRAD